jgi:uncharacterized protein YjlB
MHRIKPDEIFLTAFEGFPNSPLPVLHYQGVLKEFERKPSVVEELFYLHHWQGSWVNGIYSFDHFHSTTHEVLAVVSGQAKVRLGGPRGKGIDLSVGDVVVIPAGVAHARLWASLGFLVVGAYPEGWSWDLRRGDPKELPIVLDNLARVALPKTDPVYGADGPLVEIWKHVYERNRDKE